jgi:hypothetical protein
MQACICECVGARMFVFVCGCVPLCVRECVCVCVCVCVTVSSLCPQPTAADLALQRAVAPA